MHKIQANHLKILRISLTLAVQSRLADRARVPSGLSAQELTWSEWPTNCTPRLLPCSLHLQRDWKYSYQSEDLRRIDYEVKKWSLARIGHKCRLRIVHLSEISANDLLTIIFHRVWSLKIRWNVLQTMDNRRTPEAGRKYITWSSSSWGSESREAAGGSQNPSILLSRSVPGNVK